MQRPTLCPDSEELARFAAGRHPDPQSVESHLAACGECLAYLEAHGGNDDLLAALRPPGSGEIDSSRPLPAEFDVDRLLEKFSAPVGDRTHPIEPDAVDEWPMTFLEPAGESNALGRLGPYLIESRLGVGGMGIVFKARDTRLGRTVALKVIQPLLAKSPSARQRFLREARAAARIVHENVVPVFDVGEAGGVPYIVMPLLQGETLGQRLQREVRLPESEVVRIGVETCRGLAAAHALGVVHRDVTPGNIWLEAETGRVRILDFGLARPADDIAPITHSGVILGTPGYMAPEVVEHQAATPRSDLFGLGCVLYRALTGRHAFVGRNLLATVRALAVEQPPAASRIDPTIRRDLSELVQRLLAKRPDDRPENAPAVARTLEQIAAPTPPRKRNLSMIAAATMFFGLLAFAAFQIVVRIYDKDGKLQAEVKVPEGGRVEVGDVGERAVPATENTKPGPPRTTEKRAFEGAPKRPGPVASILEHAYLPELDANVRLQNVINGRISPEPRVVIAGFPSRTPSVLIPDEISGRSDVVLLKLAGIPVRSIEDCRRIFNDPVNSSTIVIDGECLVDEKLTAVKWVLSDRSRKMGRSFIIPRISASTQLQPRTRIAIYAAREPFVSGNKYQEGYKSEVPQLEHYSELLPCSASATILSSSATRSNHYVWNLQPAGKRLVHELEIDVAPSDWKRITEYISPNVAIIAFPVLDGDRLGLDCYISAEETWAQSLRSGSRVSFVYTVSKDRKDILLDDIEVHQVGRVFEEKNFIFGGKNNFTSTWVRLALSAHQLQTILQVQVDSKKNRSDFKLVPSPKAAAGVAAIALQKVIPKSLNAEAAATPGDSPSKERPRRKIVNLAKLGISVVDAQDPANPGSPVVQFLVADSVLGGPHVPAELLKRQTNPLYVLEIRGQKVATSADCLRVLNDPATANEYRIVVGFERSGEKFNLTWIFPEAASTIGESFVIPQVWAYEAPRLGEAFVVYALDASTCGFQQGVAPSTAVAKTPWGMRITTEEPPVLLKSVDVTRPGSQRLKHPDLNNFTCYELEARLRPSDWKAYASYLSSHELRIAVPLLSDGKLGFHVVFDPQRSWAQTIRTGDKLTFAQVQQGTSIPASAILRSVPVVKVDRKLGDKGELIGIHLQLAMTREQVDQYFRTRYHAFVDGGFFEFVPDSQAAGLPLVAVAPVGGKGATTPSAERFAPSESQKASIQSKRTRELVPSLGIYIENAPASTPEGAVQKNPGGVICTALRRLENVPTFLQRENSRACVIKELAGKRVNNVDEFLAAASDAKLKDATFIDAVAEMDGKPVPLHWVFSENSRKAGRSFVFPDVWAYEDLPEPGSEIAILWMGPGVGGGFAGGGLGGGGIGGGLGGGGLGGGPLGQGGPASLTPEVASPAIEGHAPKGIVPGMAIPSAKRVRVLSARVRGEMKREQLDTWPPKLLGTAARLVQFEVDMSPEEWRSSEWAFRRGYLRLALPWISDRSVGLDVVASAEMAWTQTIQVGEPVEFYQRATGLPLTGACKVVASERHYSGNHLLDGIHLRVEIPGPEVKLNWSDDDGILTRPYKPGPRRANVNARSGGLKSGCKAVLVNSLKGEVLVDHVVVHKSEKGDGLTSSLFDGKAILAFEADALEIEADAAALLNSGPRLDNDTAVLERIGESDLLIDIIVPASDMESWKVNDRLACTVMGEKEPHGFGVVLHKVSSHKPSAAVPSTKCTLRFALKDALVFLRLAMNNRVDITFSRIK